MRGFARFCWKDVLEHGSGNVVAEFRHKMPSQDCVTKVVTSLDLRYEPRFVRAFEDWSDVFGAGFRVLVRSSEVSSSPALLIMSVIVWPQPQL